MSAEFIVRTDQQRVETLKHYSTSSQNEFFYLILYIGYKLKIMNTKRKLHSCISFQCLSSD